jgi:TolA-binding protein
VRDAGEDLSIRARRGELDESHAKQLGLLLDSSLEARLAHRAGCEFDAQDSILPGDHALAERISERLLRARPFVPPAKPGPKLWVKGLLGAAALGALVLALLLGNRQPRVEPARGLITNDARRAGAGETVAQRGPASASPAQSAGGLGVEPYDNDLPVTKPGVPPRSSDPIAAPQAVRPRRERRAPAGSPVEPRTSLSEKDSADSASALFARANRARRETDTERAVTLYERLQQRYPSSPEALASQIPLGLLMLQRGQASRALPHFAAYLERAPNGELGPEALWGQAQALFALGRPEPARQALRLLLSKHPESAYAGAARAKLQAEQ